MEPLFGVLPSLNHKKPECDKKRTSHLVVADGDMTITAAAEAAAAEAAANVKRPAAPCACRTLLANNNNAKWRSCKKRRDELVATAIVERRRRYPQLIGDLVEATAVPSRQTQVPHCRLLLRSHVECM